MMAKSQLQEFERPHLKLLRAGKMSHHDYLEILKERIKDHRIVDMELGRGIDANLDRILHHRERFGEKGWKIVRNYLKAVDQDEHWRELLEIDNQLRDHMKNCFKQIATEVETKRVRITRVLTSWLPWVAEKTLEVADQPELGKNVRGLLSEGIRFFRGQSRQGKTPQANEE